jgi:hypothetical protein
METKTKLYFHNCTVCGYEITAYHLGWYSVDCRNCQSEMLSSDFKLKTE